MPDLVAKVVSCLGDLKQDREKGENKTKFSDESNIREKGLVFAHLTGKSQQRDLELPGHSMPAIKMQRR